MENIFLFFYIGSWSNVEQAMLKVTEGLSNVPNQTMRTKLEESLSLVKRWVPGLKCGATQHYCALGINNSITFKLTCLFFISFSVFPKCCRCSVTLQSTPPSHLSMPSSCWKGPWIWQARHSLWWSSWWWSRECRWAYLVDKCNLRQQRKHTS